MKHELRYSCLAACLALLFMLGCSPGNDFEKAEHRDLDIKKMSFKEALQIPLFNNAYSRLSKSTHTTDPLVAKTALEEMYGFDIVVDAPVKIISNPDGSKNYVMLIERLLVDDTKIENLVINIKDDSANAYITKYNLAAPPQKEEEHESYVFNIESVENTYLQGFGREWMVCQVIHIVLCVWDPDGTWGGIHIAQPVCLQYPENLLYIRAEVCVEFSEADPPQGTSGGGGGGSGTGSNGGSDEPAPDPDDAGQHGGIVTIVVPQEIDDPRAKTQPCEELAKLTQPTHPVPNPNVGNGSNAYYYPNVAIQNVRDHVTDDAEFGYSFRNLPGFEDYGATARWQPNNNPVRIRWTPNPYMFAVVHSHPKDTTIPMFSHEDMYTLVQLSNPGNYTPVNPAGDDLFSCLMVANQGGSVQTYAIKIKNRALLQQLINIHGTDKWLDLKSKLENAYDELGENPGPTDYQRAFLKIAASYGISLYQMTPGVNASAPATWDELTIDSHDQYTVKRNPC